MAEKNPPNADVHPMRIIWLIPKNPPPQLFNRKQWSPTFHDFIAKCLVKDPKFRPSAAALLGHKFIQKAKGKVVIEELVARYIEIKNRKKNYDDNDSFSDSESIEESEEEETIKSVRRTVNSNSEGVQISDREDDLEDLIKIDSNYNTVVVNDEEDQTSREDNQNDENFNTVVQFDTIEEIKDQNENFDTFVQNDTVVEKKNTRSRSNPPPSKNRKNQNNKAIKKKSNQSELYSEQIDPVKGKNLPIIITPPKDSPQSNTKLPSPRSNSPRKTHSKSLSNSQTGDEPYISPRTHNNSPNIFTNSPRNTSPNNSNSTSPRPLPNFPTNISPRIFLNTSKDNTSPRSNIPSPRSTQNSTG
jgi:hypothetical protein